MTFLPVVGVLRQQQLAELVLEPLEVGLGLGDLVAHRSRSSPVASASISRAASRSSTRLRYAR